MVKDQGLRALIPQDLSPWRLGQQRCQEPSITGTWNLRLCRLLPWLRESSLRERRPVWKEAERLKRPRAGAGVEGGAFLGVQTSALGGEGPGLHQLQLRTPVGEFRSR